MKQHLIKSKDTLEDDQRSKEASETNMVNIHIQSETETQGAHMLHGISYVTNPSSVKN